MKPDKIQSTSPAAQKSSPQDSKAKQKQRVTVASQDAMGGASVARAANAVGSPGQAQPFSEPTTHAAVNSSADAEHPLPAPRGFVGAKVAQPLGWTKWTWGTAQSLHTFDGFLGSLLYAAALLLTPVTAVADVFSAIYAWFTDMQPISDPGEARSAMILAKIRNEEPGLENLSGAFDLNAEFAKDTLGLPAFLKHIASNDEAVTALAEHYDIPEVMVRSLTENPERMMRLLVWSPADMRRIFALKNEAYQRGQEEGLEWSSILPSTVNLDTFDPQTIPVKQPPPTKVAPGIFQGEVPVQLTAADTLVAKQNQLWAEVLQRLSNNKSGIHGSFTAIYDGKSYSNLRSFLTMLRKGGHEIKAELIVQGADLPDISKMGEDGELDKVAIPAFSRVGLKDKNGRDILFPMMHDELKITITPPVGGKLPAMTGDARFYQGVDSIGFSPGSVTVDSAWVAPTKLATLTGDVAFDAVMRSALYSDAVAKAAKDQHYTVDGYGIFGNCGDSVMVALHHTLKDLDNPDLEIAPSLKTMLQGRDARMVAFPYMLDVERILPELKSRQSKAKTHAERTAWQRIIVAAKALPDDAATDAQPTSEAAERVLAILEAVWPENAPFEAIDHAKAALHDYLQ